jgi:hypothetical protein
MHHLWAKVCNSTDLSVSKAFALLGVCLRFKEKTYEAHESSG